MKKSTKRIIIAGAIVAAFAAGNYAPTLAGNEPVSSIILEMFQERDDKIDALKDELETVKATLEGTPTVAPTDIEVEPEPSSTLPPQYKISILLNPEVASQSGRSFVAESKEAAHRSLTEANIPEENILAIYEGPFTTIEDEAAFNAGCEALFKQHTDN